MTNTMGESACMQKVSVIMGIYNCEKTLDEALQSILHQTYTNWEVILCEDGSSDSTYDIAQKYVNAYPNQFLLLKNEKNMGLNFTLNRCLERASGAYIARMDGDDISLPERFQKQVEFLDRHSEYDIVSTPMIFFDESGEWGRNHLIAEPQITDFVYHAPVHCHAPSMIRVRAFRAVNGYTEDPRYLRFEDCNLWYKLYAAGYRGYNLSEPLYKMRDDYAAMKRRRAGDRLRAAYVQYTGFCMVKMPLRYYPCLLTMLIKQLILICMPKQLYMFLRKRKINGRQSG